MSTMFFLSLIFCGFTVICGAILGEQNKEVILPCSFTPGSEETIHWNTENNKKVHTYFYSKDQLENQDQDYSGRTSLFLNEISNGNASLLLRNLKKSDENTYNCYVGTKEGKMENEVILQVIDLQHKMEYNWDNGQLHLTCSVNASSPDDITVKWYENDQPVNEEKSTESSYTVKNQSSTYECTVDHSGVKSRWTGTWRMKEPIKRKNDIVTCGCNFCKATNSDFYAKWYLREGTNEVIVASLDNSSLNVSPYYSNKIVQYEEYNMNLSNFGTNDSGLYICSITSQQKMIIEMTSVNVTVETEIPNDRHHYLLLSLFIISCFIIIIITIYCYKKRRTNNRSATLPDSEETNIPLHVRAHKQESCTAEQPNE